MKIKVIKCSSDGYWYRNSIGEIFRTQGVTELYEGNKVYIVNSEKYILYINFDDAEVLE